MTKKAHDPPHHIIPTSIGGPRWNYENIYDDWPREKHEAYHQYIRNFPPSVVIKILEAVTDKNGDWNRKLMSEKDYAALQLAFEGKKPAGAVQFLRDNFLPIEDKYLNGELPEKFKKIKKRT